MNVRVGAALVAASTTLTMGGTSSSCGSSKSPYPDHSAPGVVQSATSVSDGRRVELRIKPDDGGPVYILYRNAQANTCEAHERFPDCER